jgi:hypothetical protein
MDVTLPSISLTHPDPETGEVLAVGMEATDNRGLEGSLLRYDAGKGWMLPTENGGGMFEISVPSTCRLLILNASAWDEEGNTRYVESVLHVSDILFPMIGAIDHTIVYDGQYAMVSLRVDVRDNVDIKRAWIEWSTQDLNRATDLVLNGSYYEGMLWADRGPGYVRLTIMATDMAGNTAAGGTETIPLQMVPEDEGGGSSWAFAIVLLMICAALAGIAIYTYIGLRRESGRRPIEIPVEE